MITARTEATVPLIPGWQTWAWEIPAWLFSLWATIGSQLVAENQILKHGLTISRSIYRAFRLIHRPRPHSTVIKASAHCLNCMEPDPMSAVTR